MANPLPITLHASGAESSSGAGAAVDIDTLRTALQLRLVVSAIEASTGLVVFVETSVDGTTWRAMGSFTPYATGVTRSCFGPAERYVRTRWQIAADKSATFTVDGAAHVIYADPVDLTTTGVRAEALEGVDDSTRFQALISATSDADGALASRYHLPITSWGDDVRARVATRAVYYIFKHRGFDPEGADAIIIVDGGFVLQNGARSAVEQWLHSVASGTMHPVGIVDSTPSKREFGARVRSKPRRDPYC